MTGFMNLLGILLSALFTLSIFSFLYKDNPFYKFAEQVFVGLSAAYWLVNIIYSIMIPNLFSKLITDFSGNLILLIPAALGLMMLMRLHPATQWISRYPIAIMIGTTADPRCTHLKSDIQNQYSHHDHPLALKHPALSGGKSALILGLNRIISFTSAKKQEGIYAARPKLGSGS
jgi:hypothetical protein